MPRRNREVENTLLNKFAFIRAATRSDDHRWLELRLPGLSPIVTKFSHTNEDIGDTLWRKIAMQLRVRPQYLNGMVDCHNSREAYYKQVATDPFPPWDHLLRGASTTPSKSPAKKASRKRGRRR